jgi:hypothetical protein
LEIGNDKTHTLPRLCENSGTLLEDNRVIQAKRFLQAEGMS